MRQTGSFADPGAAFVLQIANTTAKTDLNLSFKLQSLDAGSQRTTTWSVQYGTGNNPTSFTTVTTAPATLTTGGSAFTNQSVTVNFGSALNNLAGPVWIRIVALSAATGSGNRPSSAIDDVSLAWSTVTVTTPTITSIAPDHATAGDPTFTLTVNGTDFVSGSSTVRWNGSARTTTFVSATQLTASIPAADITTAGTAAVTVVTTGAPSASNAVPFTINPNLSPILTASTLTAFGTKCINGGPYGPNTFTISGVNLSTADVTVAALDGYTYSTTAGGIYTSTLALPQAGGTFSQAIYVHFDPTLVQSYNGNIAVGGGGAAGINVAASGSGINTAPTVTTGAASAITTSSATVAGTLNTATSCGTVTAYGIEYSTTPGFTAGTGTAVASTNLSGTAFSSALSGLNPCTVYYTHAYATRASGTTYGTQGTFTTAIIDAPVAAAGTSIGDISFTANWGAVTSATGYALDVSTSPTFGTSSPGTSTTETFTDVPSGGSSYSTRSWTGVDGVGWTATNARIDQTIISGNPAICLQDASGTYLESDAIAGGVSAISFDVQQKFVGSGGVLTVRVLSGASFTTSTTIGTISYTTTLSSFNQTFPDIAGPIKIRVDNNTAARPAIDNLSFTRAAGSTPSFLPGYNNLPVAGTSQAVTGLDPLTTYYYRVRSVGANCSSANSNVITVNTTAGSTPTLTAGTLADFGNVCINSTSPAGSVHVNGTSLTAANITVAALSGFTYSTTEFGTYTSSLTIPHGAGTFSQDIWVKFTPTAAQAYAGDITIGGGGAANITVAATGEGIDTPSEVSTGTASQTGDNSAEAFGSIDVEGCFATTAYGIEYSTTQGFTPGAGTQVAASNLSSGGFSSELTGLDLCTDIYFRAYLTNSQGTLYGTEESFQNTDISAAVATAATGTGVDAFTANWDAVSNATGYFLDVSTSPTFGTPLSNSTFTTGFDQGRSNLPTGWTQNGLGSDYTSDGGVAPPSLKFDTSDDQLQTPTFGGPATSISFWYKGQGTAGSASTLLTEGFNGSTWVTIGQLTGVATNATGTQTYPLNQADGFVQFRFTYTKNTGNLAFDDFSVNFLSGTPDFLPGYENLPVAGTSVNITGLMPGTTYYYRVRTNSGCGASLNSNVISTTTVVPGCTDPLASNYDAGAVPDNSSCTYCTPTVTYNTTIPTPIGIGTGIPANNAAISVDCHPFTLGLTAYNRYVGAIVPVGNVYTTTTGHSPVSGSDPTPDLNNARWNVLGSIDLGTFDFTQVNVFLDADFDPGATPVWHTIDLSAFAVGIGNQHILQAAENPLSAFWSTLAPGITFDPNVAGIYDVRLRLESPTTGEELANLAIQVVVEQTCTAHTGNIWYVNDASTAGDGYTTAIGSDSNTGSASCPFGTITHAISQAAPGDTIRVDAGVYAENVVVDKLLHLQGIQYNHDPVTRTGAESVIHPAVSDPDPTSPTGSIIMYVADNVGSGTSINGFTFDGDNPGLTSGVVANGADMDAIEAIASYTGNDSITIAYNAIKNVSYAGLELDNYQGTGIVNGITVHHNLFDNITGDSWGIGMILQYNAYADITANTMTRVRIGIQTGNHTLANTGANPQISGNTITSYRLGIFHNVQYAAASPFQITNNNLLTEAGAPNNTGIMTGYIDPTVSMNLQGNNVTGARQGIMMWDSESPAGITVEGGTIADCGIGVFVNNYDGYPASPDASQGIHAILNNVTITNADTGVYVKDNLLNTHAAATLHVDITGNSTINVADGGVNLRVAGAKASAAFAGTGVNLTGNALRHIRLESNGSTVPATDIDATQVQFNGATATTATGFTIEDLIDHKVDLLTLGEVTFVPGEVFVTVNSFVAPNTAGSVQRGIDVSANGETVHVNDGTYNEDVNVNKAITLQGNDRDLTVLRGLYGTTANALSVGANATVKNLTSTRDYGADLAAWQASPKVNGLTFTGNGGIVDNVRVTGHRNGVYINNRQNVQVLNSIIEANRTGIQLGNNVSGTQVLNNFIQDNFTMGLLFNFGLGGTPNTTGLVVSENSFSGNWYTEVSYQGTPSSAVSGADFSCNWYGTASPVVSATPTGEPGYASQVPGQFGGSAPGTPPAGQIMGTSAALVPYEPYGRDGTDDDAAAAGFQPVPGTCAVVYYSQATGNMSDPIWDVVPVGTPGPATFSSTTDAVVQNTHTVTNTGAVDLHNLTVETGGSLALGAGSSLNVNGDEATIDGGLTAADSSTLALVGANGVILQAAAPLNLYNLTVNTPNGALTDATISIRGTLQLDDGELESQLPITLTSTAAGTGRLGPVGATASYTGNLTVQRYIPAGHTNWRMLGSPVAGQTVNSWKDDFFTAGFPGSHYPNFFSPVGSGIFWPSIRWYDETNLFADPDSGVVGVTSQNQALVPGQGFLAWSGDNLSTTAAFTVDVTGVPTIAQTPLALPVSYTPSGEVNADGWNLVANPLPSPIDFTLISRGSDVDNAYWIFDPVAGNNRAWSNGLGQGALNGKIQSSQGFWVKANGSNATATVSEAAKVNLPAGGVFGGNQDAVLPVIGLGIASTLNTYSDEATLVLANGSPAYGGSDALKMPFKTIGAPQLGILSTDGQQLAIDFRGAYNAAIAVPLTLDVDADGTYTITASMAGITSLSCISIEDLRTGAVTPLTDGATYSFSANTVEDAGQARFILHGTAPMPLVVDNAQCYGEPGMGSVVAYSDPVSLTWTDAFGNTLLTQSGDGSDSTVFVFEAPAGNYMVHATPGGACGTLVASFTITAPAAVEANLQTTPATCHDSEDGLAELGVLGGTAPYTYLWGDGSTLDHLAGPAGEYSVTVTDANGCTLTTPAVITANGALAAFSINGTEVLAGSPVGFLNGSAQADSYLWEFGDGATSTEAQPMHSWLLPGTYTVTLTATSGECTSTFSMEVAVDVNTGIAQAPAAGPLNVWATPDHLVVEHPFNTAPVDVDVFDATGRLAMGRSGMVQPGRILLGDRSLNTGVWFVRITSGTVQRTFRVPLVR